MNIENSSTFGNYLIHGIDEIIVADAISWWPATPGWAVLTTIAGVFLLAKAIQMAKRWWADRYRRQAIKKLDQLQNKLQPLQVVYELPFYLKAVALQAYPRKQVASLSGKNWLAFLDAHYQGPSFQQDPGRQLLSFAYQPSDHRQLDDNQAAGVIDMARLWIATHTVDKHV